ncbi:hypothetical protein [Amedibacillus dolichus]
MIENSIRLFTIKRKNWLISESSKGARVCSSLQYHRNSESKRIGSI